MKRLRTRSFLMVALPLAALAPSSAADEPALDDVLKFVPDDAALVVVIPNLSDVVAGIQVFGAAAGVQDFVEVDADTILDDLEVGNLPDEWLECLRKNGPFVFVLTDPDADPLLICTVMRPPDAPPSDLIELKGNVLITAPDAEVMHAVKSTAGTFAKRFATQVQPTLAKHDLVLYFDVQAWSVQIEQMLSLGEMLAQMGAAAAGPGAQLNLTMVNWMFEMLRTAYTESRTMVLAARIDADGLHFRKLVNFDPAGKVANYLAKVRKPEKDLLRGLPPQPGMFVMAAEWGTPGNVETMSEKILDVVLAATTQPADEAERPKLTPEMRKLYRILDGYNGVMTFGSEPAGMVINGIYLTDQPQTYFDGFPALWKLSAPMMANMGPDFTMDVSESMETVGSTKARVYRVKFDVADEETKRILQVIYGESITFYTAPHPEGVAYAMGPADVARANLEKLLAEKGSPLSTDRRVADVLKKLSPKPRGFLLLDLAGLMAWYMKVAEVPESEMPQFEPPKTPLPYLGFGLYLHEASIGTELYFPAKVLKYIIESSETPTSAPSGSEPY